MGKTRGNARISRSYTHRNRPVVRTVLELVDRLGLSSCEAEITQRVFDHLGEAAR